MEKEQIIDEFHKLYYSNEKKTWMDTKWLGVYIAKCPLDMWQYQEIIVETQPDVIIETGTWCGGSAAYLRSIMDMIGKEDGKVITIDINPVGKMKYGSRIIQLIGDSVDPKIVALVESYIRRDEKVMVILDSDHSKNHVMRELNTWASMVSIGCYLIVEDTNIFGHPVVRGDHGEGPYEALVEWLPRHKEFVHDNYRERFMMTFNPKGYYKRV